MLEKDKKQVLCVPVPVPAFAYFVCARTFVYRTVQRMLQYFTLSRIAWVQYSSLYYLDLQSGTFVYEQTRMRGTCKDYGRMCMCTFYPMNIKT